MDPIGSSTFNLHAGLGTKALEADKIQQILISTKSLNQKIEQSLKTALPQIIATLIAVSSHVSIGNAMAFSAILLPQLQADNSDLAVTATESSWIASVLALSAPFGAITAGFVMDYIGRINTLKLSTIPGIIGWITIATATNVPMLIIGRIITGLTSTLATSPAIVYTTEIARSDIRGALLSLGPAFVSLGMVAGYMKGWLFNWRTVALICNTYTLIPCVLFFFIPESPAWLVSQGRIEEATKSLNWFNKYQLQPNILSQHQIRIMLSENAEKAMKSASNDAGIFGKIKQFLQPTGYKPLLILSGLFFFQQFSGIYICLFYSVTFFQNVGTTFNPYIASVMIGVVRLVMSMANTWMLKQFGRRSLIMISGTIMGISTSISGLFTLWIKQGTTTTTWIPVVFLILYVVGSMVGLLTIPWTMTAELFPIEIRSIAHSLITSIANILMFLAVQNYMNLEQLLGGSMGMQWFFAGISLLAVVFTFVFLPETHRKSLADIETYFKSNMIYLCQNKNTTNTDIHHHYVPLGKIVINNNNNN